MGGSSPGSADGAAASNLLYGGAGDDLVLGAAWDDTLHGDDGEDMLAGFAGDDALYGGAGDDVLYGMEGDDLLFGGTGGDILFGGAGTDRIDGGAGPDILFGGDGADVFIFRAGDSAPTSPDRIEDFQRGPDKIDFTALGLAPATAYIGEAAFSVAGRFVPLDGGGMVEVDLTGNGQADLAIFLANIPEMIAIEFLF